MFRHLSGPSPLSAADPMVLRSLLEIDRELLAKMATETDSMTILEDLCGSLRDFTQADSVGLDFDAADGTTDGTNADAGCHISPIRSSTDLLLARLTVRWPAGQERPTALDRQVVERFASLASVVIERHFAQRQQLRAIAIDREMIAGEIHDDPIQTMTAVSLRIQRLLNSVEDRAQRDQLTEVRSLTDDAIARLRHVMFSLHPETLIEDGLVASIEAYCDTYVSHEGLLASVSGKEPSGLPPELAMLAFRLTRGALVNVLRHARATTVSIDVSVACDHLIVEVADDGIGFDVGSLARTAVGHFGIPHAKTLARWAGGTYRVTSEAGQGTRVVIDLPML